MLAALALEVFLIPNRIIDGGITGISIILSFLTKKNIFSVGQVILLINLMIYMVAGILFGWDRALYSIMTYFITYKIIDTVSEGLDQEKSALIITAYNK